MKKTTPALRPELIIAGSEIDLKPILCGSQECHPLHKVGPYIRDYYLIHYCISGKGTVYNQTGVYSVSSGQVFIIFPGDECTYISDETDPWNYVWIGFSGKYAEKLRTLNYVIDYPFDTFLKIKNLVTYEINSPEEYLAQICDLFHNLLIGEKRKTDIIDEAKRYIEFCYMNNDISVNSVADHVHLDRSYLSRTFKHRFGITMKNYIKKKRLEAACHILENGYSISETAAMLGYSDSFTFSKSFKAYYGVPPIKYKEAFK